MVSTDPADERQTVSCHPKKSRRSKKGRGKAGQNPLRPSECSDAGSSLEWTRTREEAIEIVIELNNQYPLDGRGASSYRESFGVLGRHERPCLARFARCAATIRREEHRQGTVSARDRSGRGIPRSLRKKLTNFTTVWNRACPLCFGKVPLVRVLVRTQNLQCPSCHANLKLSRPSRALASAVGLSIGLAMVRCLAIASVRGEWILAVVVGFVGYGVGCAAALGVISDLVAKRQGEAERFPHFRS